MKRVSVLISAALMLCACSGADEIALVGGASDVSQWRDRGVVINYWAEWCAPCREEIPEFNELYHASSANGPIVVGVNYDGLKGGELLEVIERMDIQFPTVLEDPRERFGYPLPEMMPTTVVLDGDLNVKATLVGPQTAVSIERALSGATGTGKP